MPPSIGMKRIVRKSKAKTEANGSAAAATLASDGIARPVTRSEFQELVAAVTLLRKQAQRQISVDAHIGSELEVFGAQVASNKSTLGKLAETVLNKTQHIQEAITKQMQCLQVESDRQLTDVRLALERLEFRFKHHIRDCQTVADQVDLHRDSLQHCKHQIGQTQLALDKHLDQQQVFMETIQYSTKSAEERVKAVTTECSSSLDAFQQRMIAFVKDVEESMKESIVVVAAQMRDVEIQGKRYKSLLHQHLDEQLNMHQTIVEFEAKLTHQDRKQEESQRLHGEEMARVEALEARMGRLVMLAERSVERDDVEQLVERAERNLKTRIEALLEVSASGD